MFNKDFFPTPQKVIEKMLIFSDVQNKVILEPSAGKGDIVTYLQQMWAKEVIACEIEPELRAITSKYCDIIANDFLTVRKEDISHIDMIVMNPPFSTQEKHILHAWDIAPEGCEIISLCNNSLLERGWNTYDKKVKELIDEYGDSEYLGKVFDTAERKTDIPVGWIRLFKPRTGESEFVDFFDLGEEYEHQENGIMSYNVIRDIVNRYVEAVKRFDDVMEKSNEINELTKPFNSYGITFGASKENGRGGSMGITRNYFKKDLQKRAWKHIFYQLSMDKYVTSGVNAQINAYIEKQVHIPFTMRNVYKMIDMLIQTNGSRMNQVLVEAFENICSYSAENSTAGEKWKTNSDYKLNKKFIIPNMANYDRRWPSDYVDLHYSSRISLEDIIKGLCYLTATNYDDIPRLREFYSRGTKLYGQWYEWGFFRVKAFKKNTIHFEFKDQKVLDMFNYRVAEIKGWQLHKARK